MKPTASFNKDLIDYPSHYIEGRTIEPIEVIEDYGLCHHLGCVVKYIARAGRKGSALQDLKKAEWYLNRERSLYGKGTPCLSALKFPPVTIDAILEDWGISRHFHIARALKAVLMAGQAGLESARLSCLATALKELQAEIRVYEVCEIYDKEQAP